MTENIFPIKREPRVRNLVDTFRNYRNFTAPEQFQRPQAWGNKDRRAYFESILMNRLEGGFVIVDLHLAITALEKNNSSDRAVSFFNSLTNDGHEYIILDGNNRLCFIKDLLNDEYKIPTGTYSYILDGDNQIRTEFICSDNNTFSTLPPIIQKLIQDRMLVISEYTQIHYEGLSDVFRNVNSGVPLNEQEIRNAMNTPWSDWIRSLRKKTEIKDLLNITKGLNHMYRLAGDEWIVQCINYVMNMDGTDAGPVNQTTMNKLYTTDINLIDKDMYEDTFVVLSEYIHRMIDDEDVHIGDEKSKFLTRPYTVMNLYWMMVYGIESYEDAATAMVEYEKATKSKSKEWPYLNEDGNNFIWACNGLGTKNNAMKMAVLSDIVESVLNRQLETV